MDKTAFILADMDIITSESQYSCIIASVAADTRKIARTKNCTIGKIKAWDTAATAHINADSLCFSEIAKANPPIAKNIANSQPYAARL